MSSRAYVTMIVCSEDRKERLQRALRNVWQTQERWRLDFELRRRTSVAVGDFLHACVTSGGIDHTSTSELRRFKDTCMWVWNSIEDDYTEPNRRPVSVAAAVSYLMSSEDVPRLSREKVVSAFRSSDVKQYLRARVEVAPSSILGDIFFPKLREEKLKMEDIEYFLSGRTGDPREQRELGTFTDLTTEWKKLLKEHFGYGRPEAVTSRAFVSNTMAFGFIVGIAKGLIRRYPVGLALKLGIECGMVLTMMNLSVEDVAHGLAYSPMKDVAHDCKSHIFFKYFFIFFILFCALVSCP